MKKIKIGIKSIASLAVLFLSIIIAWRMGFLRLGYLRNLDSFVPFFIGTFSILLSVSFFSFLRIRYKSEYRFLYTRDQNIPDEGEILLLRYKNHILTIGENKKHEAYEIYPLLQGIIYLLVFINIGLMTFNNRAFHLMKTLPERVDLFSTRYCLEEEEDPFEDPALQGCQLLIKAYQLGYAKDLGPCEPKREDFGEDEICPYRRIDEPYLHYMSRLLAQFNETLKENTTKSKFEELKENFNVKVDHIPMLAQYQKHAIKADPRASHHIFTNLPYPEPWVFAKFHDYFSPGHCIDKYQNLSNSILIDPDDSRATSKILDHATGHLLFNNRVKISVGFCKEYKIHWKSKENVCNQLANNPEEILERKGILKETRVVLNRYRIKKAYRKLNQFLKKDENEKKEQEGKKKPLKKHSKKKNEEEKKSEKKIRQPNEIISFQCFIEKEKGKRLDKTYSFQFSGVEFIAREIQFPKLSVRDKMQVFSYTNFSELLAKDFQYDAFVSKAGIEIAEDDSAKIAALSQPDYLMTRLELLRNADIFLGHEWIYQRSDLLEVYPFYLHLKQFVGAFRNKYGKDRGRL